MPQLQEFQHHLDTCRNVQAQLRRIVMHLDGELVPPTSLRTLIDQLTVYAEWAATEAEALQRALTTPQAARGGGNTGD